VGYNIAMSPNDIQRQLSQGFRAIRLLHQVPEDESESVAIKTLAEQAVVDATVARRDATEIEFVTLDPAASTDLDQAFAVFRDAEMLVLLYAIADIGAFVPRGGEIEAEAFKRGVTVYCPDCSVPLYPRILSRDRASLLPDGPRPAILLTVQVDPEGNSRLRNVERATIRSRAKLAYEEVSDSDLSADTLEFANRIMAAELRRGAFRVGRTEQEVIVDEKAPGGLRLEFAPKRLSEERNAALSLAANLAVATHFLEAGVGLFRVMDEPDAFEITHLRRRARALKIAWSDEESLHAVVERLDISNARHLEFCQVIRRMGGGASYLQYPVPFSTPEEQKKNALQIAKPWHAALAASYAHATAPMRRLADRYVLDLMVAQFAKDGQAVRDLLPILAQLPPVMEAAERRASNVNRESIDLIETLMLSPFIDKELTATIIDVTPGSWQVQIQEPAVVRRVRVEKGLGAKLGEMIRVKVVASQDLPSPRRQAPLDTRTDDSGLNVARLQTVELLLVGLAES
jgi:exoribonuclease R